MYDDQREDASRTARGQPGSGKSRLDTAPDCGRDAIVDTLGADAGAGPAANFAAFLKGGSTSAAATGARELRSKEGAINTIG